MDYKDKDGNWIGFDADMASLLAKKLGVKVKFVVIDWDTKAMELKSKNIDVVWNGMTLTDEVVELEHPVDINSMPILSEVYVGVYNNPENEMVDSWICNNKITISCG